jgi:hypothetical protein
VCIKAATGHLCNGQGGCALPCKSMHWAELVPHPCASAQVVTTIKYVTLQWPGYISVSPGPVLLGFSVGENW